jgi:hypothetical protein
MKLRAYPYSAMVLAAWISLPFVALSQNPRLTIERGVYVREPAQCRDAPNATIMSWDRVRFFGPHSSKCTSSVPHKNGRK